METLKIETTYNIGFGSVTISLTDLPLYGEGRNLDQAVDDLINAMIEFTNIYQAKLETYRSQWTESQIKAMDLLIECRSERDKIKAVVTNYLFEYTLNFLNMVSRLFLFYNPTLGKKL